MLQLPGAPSVPLNHNDHLDSAFALANEMGEAMHSRLSSKSIGCFKDPIPC